MFKFTFNIGSHLYNPFTAQAQAQVHGQPGTTEERNTFGSNTNTTYTAAGQSQNGTRKLPAPPPRCGLTIAVPEAECDNSGGAGPTLTPLSRKRGWAPSSSSPSEPRSLTTSTNGWLDTPSRYVKAAAAGGGSHKGTESEQDFPPAKRRKTITDSILSTALSAALIGTAVGMSAYRMWRDRGTPKQANDSPSVEEIIMDSPPPPYAQEDWVHAVVPRGKATPVVSATPQYHHHAASSPPASSLPLPSIPRTPKSARASKARRAARMTRHRSTHALASPRVGMPSPSKSKTVLPNPEDDPEEEIDSHMDSMGDKIRKLIEEGQRALGKEVVIMNDDDRDNEEGAVDDGLDGWEEVDERKHFTLRIPGERRKKRRPSNANANGIFSIAAGSSTSLPSRFNEHTPIFHADRPVSPKQKRPRALTGTSRLGSPVVEPPSVQVIYEPLDLSTSSLTPDTSFNYEDEDSLNLSQRMEKIRQAYRLQ